MKSYNHLYETYISDENIRLAIKNLCKHKKKTREYRLRIVTGTITIGDLYYNPDKYIPMLKNYASHFHNMRHKPKEIYDGISRKKRKIIVPTIEEQIVHHMVINVIGPILSAPMYEHSYGSLPGKGGVNGSKRMRVWISKGGKNIKYCLKMDVHKFFDSIDKDILKGKIKELIHDDKFLDVLDKVIDVSNKGLPLGFYTSQWLANYYLTDLDHYIKEELGAKIYMRYMDDMAIFSSNKKELRYIRHQIDIYLKTRLNLEMKNDWSVFRFNVPVKNGEKPKDKYRFLDFMGYRFYRNRTTIRKSIMLKMGRYARRIHNKEKPTLYDVKKMLSYKGWLKHTDSYSFYLECIKPYVSFQKLRRRISNHDKKEKKDGMEKSRINVKSQPD